MVGVDESTKGGMWTVVENYLKDAEFVSRNDLIYIPTSITGCSNLKKMLFTLKAYWKIIKVFREKKINITHVHMSERASIGRKKIVMNYAKKHGSKVVLHMHGAEFEVLYKQMSEKNQKFVKETLNLADRIIILGEYWRKFIGTLVDEPNKIQVVYNAVSVPEEYSYNSESNSILFLGAVSKRKGIDVLMKALQMDATELKDRIKVKIFGPDVEGDIEERIVQAGLQEWVSYCGWLDKDKKAEVLKNVAVNVLPSYNEGLPMTILEAMAYGVPSITTSVAAIPEAVNKNNGIIVEPGDVEGLAHSISKIILDKMYRLELSKNAYRDAVNCFSIKTHIAVIQSIYEEMAK